MKKIALIILAGIVLAGCEKENDNNLLAGTCWYDQDDPEQVLYEYRRICFEVSGASYSYNMWGTYRIYRLEFTYNAPNIKITYEDGSRFGSGYIDGDILYITDGFDKGTYERRP